MAGIERARVCVRVIPLLLNSHQTTGSATNLTNIPKPEFSDVLNYTLCHLLGLFLKLAFLLKS